MKIALASDHAGYEEKERLLDELGIQYEDLGALHAKRQNEFDKQIDFELQTRKRTK